MASSFFEFQKQIARTKRGASPSSGAPSDGADKGARGESAETPFTVSQLTSRIKRVLTTGMPASVHVTGEVSNFKKQNGSGHFYFTLRDADSCLDCVMFNSEASRVKFTPTDTMELLARGRIDVYASRGKYQLYVDSLQPVGTGALELAFKQMRERLEREGLFAAERKRPMPAYPLNVAIVTSSSSAAYQDILKVLRRFPWLRLMIMHVPVQGDEAGPRIADAINWLSDGHANIGGVDVILLARGGGSLEDLWSFNEECVGRAIFNSKIPVITGIGHEVDTSIADLVADYFAHTPTEAAQVLTQQWRSAEAAVERITTSMARALRNATADARHRLRHAERHEFFRRPTHRVDAFRQHLTDRERALAMAMTGQVAAAHRQIEGKSLALARHGPEAVVARLRAKVDAVKQSLVMARAACILRCHTRLARQRERLINRHPRHRVALAESRITDIEKRLATAMHCRIDSFKLGLEGRAKHLHAIGPQEVLRRGYSITTIKKTGEVIRDAKQVRGGERIVTHLADGEIESIAEDPKQPGLFT